MQKKKRKGDIKLRWKESSPELRQLQHLIPEAKISTTDRRVLLSFPTRTALRRCINHLLGSADEDVLSVETIQEWPTSWSFKSEGLKVVKDWQTWHLSREAVFLILAVLNEPVPGKD